MSIVLELLGNLSPQPAGVFSNNEGMKADLVKKWMTPDPIVIGPQTTLPEAHQLMKAANVRRLPVVGADRLVGVITLEDIRDASPADPGAMNLYELNYELANITVDQVMTHNPITISPSDTIQDSASLMLVHGISGLPVVAGDKLVGIITESDIFRILAKSME